MRRAWSAWEQHTGGQRASDQGNSAPGDGGWERDERAGSGFAGAAPGWQADYETSWEHVNRPVARPSRSTSPGWESWRRQQQAGWQWEAGPGGLGGSASGGGGGGAWARADVRRGLAELGLPHHPPPTAAALKRAFLRCAMAHHPDRHAGDAGGAVAAEARFKRARAAFDLLQPHAA